MGRASPATLVSGTPSRRPTIETDAPDADAIADGPIVRPDEVEIALTRIDDDRSGRLARMERHDLPRIGVVRLLLVRGSLLRCLALDVHRDLLCDRDRSGKRGRENGDRDGQPSAQHKTRYGNHQTLPLPPTVAALHLRLKRRGAGDVPFPLFRHEDCLRVTRTWSPPTSGGLPSTARLKPRASEAKGAEVIRKGDRNVTIATSDHAAAVDAAACRTRILLGSLSLSWPPRKNSGSFVTAERTVSGRGTTVHQAITPAIRLEGGLADGDADHAVRPAAPALCSSQPFFVFTPERSPENRWATNVSHVGQTTQWSSSGTGRSGEIAMSSEEMLAWSSTSWRKSSGLSAFADDLFPLMRLHRPFLSLLVTGRSHSGINTLAARPKRVKRARHRGDQRKSGPFPITVVHQASQLSLYGREVRIPATRTSLASRRAGPTKSRRSTSLTLKTSPTPVNLGHLRAVFHNPEELRSRRTRDKLTREAADQFQAISDKLQQRNPDREAVAHFVNQLVSCFFADSVKLLPNGLWKKLLQAAERKPDQAKTFLTRLFDGVAKGGDFDLENILEFNGGLFDGRAQLALEQTASMSASTFLPIASLREGEIVGRREANGQAGSVAGTGIGSVKAGSSAGAQAVSPLATSEPTFQEQVSRCSILGRGGNGARMALDYAANWPHAVGRVQRGRNRAMRYGASTFVWVSPFSNKALDLVDRVKEFTSEAKGARRQFPPWVLAPHDKLVDREAWRSATNPTAKSPTRQREYPIASLRLHLDGWTSL